MATHARYLSEFPNLRSEHNGEQTLGSLLAMLRRQQTILLGVLLLSLTGVTFYCMMATRRYQAVGVVQIQKDSAGAFGLESSVMGDAADSASDALDYNITLQTEANILSSESLALRVIQDLRMETTQDFYPVKKKDAFLPSWLFFWRKPVEPMSVPLDQAPDRRYAVLKMFASHLKVEPVTGTRLIEIRYASPDPQLSAAVVNHLIEALMDYSFQAQFHATALASSWLTTQLEDLRKETKALQDKAVRLQHDAGMFGEDESHNVVLARLEELNQSLAAAESNRILKEAVYRVASSGDPELISGLSGNAGMAAMPSMSNPLGLIQSLRAQEATVKAELDQDRVKYGTAYPRVAELQAELKGIGQSIHDEVHRIGERAHTDYEITQRAETEARNAFEQQKRLANDLNDKAIAFEMAKQEADSSRQVYEGLLGKLKQAGVLEGLRSTNITIVNPARVPSRSHPKSPNIPLYYVAALAAGLFFGACAAIGRDMSDTKLRSTEELEAVTGTPLFGLLPVMDFKTGSPRRGRFLPGGWSSAGKHGSRENAIAPLNYIGNPFAEALRGLRTSFLLSRSGSPPQVVVATSACAGEGKSTVSIHLAIALAQQGARVLLVDADLRHPVLHERFSLPAQPGLSCSLTDDRVRPEPHQVKSSLPLFVLCGGPVPPLPAELLGAKRMQTLLEQWRGEYDFILLDGPPVLPVTDAIVLSQMCDAALLVARHGYTEKKSIRRAYQAVAMKLPSQTVLGTVLNGVSGRSPEFYEYYGYRGNRPYAASGIGNVQEKELL